MFRCASHRLDCQTCRQPLQTLTACECAGLQSSCLFLVVLNFASHIYSWLIYVLFCFSSAVSQFGMNNVSDNYELQVSTDFVHSEWFDWTTIASSRIVMKACLRMVYADIYGDFDKYEIRVLHGFGEDTQTRYFLVFTLISAIFIFYRSPQVIGLRVRAVGDKVWPGLSYRGSSHEDEPVRPLSLIFMFLLPTIMLILHFQSS